MLGCARQVWLGALVAATLSPSLAYPQMTMSDIRAVETEFRVRLSDGRTLGSGQLVGAVLAISGPEGAEQHFRVDAVEPDPAQPHHIVLHSLSIQDKATGTWSSFCAPGADGNTQAFPLAGSWTDDGRHVRDHDAFTLICTGGAVGKCVRWGYMPWRSAANGVSLWDHHQPCVRMVRADYGGDGDGHTRDDTPIDILRQPRAPATC
jgi:hypothetical protein